MLAWGLRSVPMYKCSHMMTIMHFHQEMCSKHSFSAVILDESEQGTRLQANLEGYFSGRDKKVYLVPPPAKLDEHGARHPLPERAAAMRHVTAQVRSSILDSLTQGDLHNQYVTDLVEFFIQGFPQAPHTHQAYNTTRQQQVQMSDALLQALTYAQRVLDIENNPLELGQDHLLLDLPPSERINSPLLLHINRPWTTSCKFHTLPCMVHNTHSSVHSQALDFASSCHNCTSHTTCTQA